MLYGTIYSILYYMCTVFYLKAVNKRKSQHFFFEILKMVFFFSFYKPLYFHFNGDTLNSLVNSDTVVQIDIITVKI